MHPYSSIDTTAAWKQTAEREREGEREIYIMNGRRDIKIVDFLNKFLNIHFYKNFLSIWYWNLVRPRPQKSVLRMTLNTIHTETPDQEL